MTALNETAYPRHKPEPTPKELSDIYTPTGAELAWAATAAKLPLTRVALVIQLKLFQRLGYFVRLAGVPEAIRQHIERQTRLLRPLRPDELARIDCSSTRHANIAALRRYFDVRPIDAGGRAWLTAIADTAAQTKNTIADIINVMLEELVHHRYELPAFGTLERMATAARDAVNSRYFASLADHLTPAAKGLIDELLKRARGEVTSAWNTLKQEPKKPTNKAVREYLQHIRQLQHLAEQLPVVDIPVPKLKRYRVLARAMDASEMAELKPTKRYALAVIFFRAQRAKTLDDAADLFIRLIQNLENNAAQKLTQHQLDRVKRTDALVSQLRDVLQAYKLNGTDRQRIAAIGDTLGDDVDHLVAECEAHLAYAGRNYLPFLLRPYASVRGLLLNCVEIMAPRSTSGDRNLERMIAALLALRSSRLEVVSAGECGLEPQADFNWMSAQWRKLVLVKPVGRAPVDKMNRKFFELAVLHQIKEELKSGDLFIERGERYDDYREQLVDPKVFKAELA